MIHAVKRSNNTYDEIPVTVYTREDLKWDVP
jgi:hypothetical protein